MHEIWPTISENSCLDKKKILLLTQSKVFSKPQNTPPIVNLLFKANKMSFINL